MIYAGVLVTPEEIQVTFAEQNSLDSSCSEPDPLGLVEYKKGKFDWVDSFSFLDREDALAEAARQIAELPTKVNRVGIATYGPILSVSLGDRDNTGRKRLYGKISDSTIHENLRGLEVYRVIRETLDSLDCPTEVVIHTDVMCGAISEAYARRKRGILGKQDVLVFFNIAEGVGGAFVMGARPWQSALHPEMGYIVAQVSPDDKWGERLRPQPGGLHNPLFIEYMCSAPNLMARSKAQRLCDVPFDDWRHEAYYLSQLCAAATFMLAPHQIVLNGRIIDEAPDEVDLLQMVRDKFRIWINSPIGLHLTYSEMDDLQKFIDLPVMENSPLRGAVQIAAQMDIPSVPELRVVK